VGIVDTFDEDMVALLASPQSISRGRAYATGGRVSITGLSDTELHALVRGTLGYRVRLWSDDGNPRWRCDCPVGLNGEFCKHCVAAATSAAAPEVGAADAAADAPAADPSAADPGGAGPNEEIARYLRSLPTEELVTLVVDQAGVDDLFRTRLQRSARLHQAEPMPEGEPATDEMDLRALKKEITAAYGRGFVSYRQAGHWASRVLEAVEWISDIGDSGHFRTAALLAQHAHKRAESAINRVDDSDGWITDISRRLAEIHAAACAEGAFPPEDLARRLIDLELDAQLDTFHRSAVSHRDALGPDGLAAYGRLAQEAHDALAPDSDRYGRAFRVRQARIAHAIATDDPDRLVEVMADDIGSPADHLEIIDAFAAVGRLDEALAWSDTSLSVFADRHHQLPPVRARRAELLRRLGDDQAVVAMYRESFEANPTPGTYRLFVDASADEEEARRLAVDHVIGLLPEAGGGGEPTIGRPVAGRAAAGVVAVLLAAGEDDRAWEVALVHGADADEWRRMAERRQVSDPESAIAVLALEVERAIERKNRSGYRTAVGLLERIERLATKANKPQLHRDLVAGIDVRHQRKTSLMELLHGGR
jgi:hypothetical protein